MSITLLAVISVIAVIAAYLFITYRRMKNMPEAATSDKITVLTDQNFQHQLKTGISLVDFWASWCVPCRMMAPVLNEIAEEVSPGVKVCKVDVEQYQAAASRYGIRGIPTMILFRNGKEVERFVGVKSKDFLIGQINKIR